MVHQRQILLQAPPLGSPRVSLPALARRGPASADAVGVVIGQPPQPAAPRVVRAAPRAAQPRSLSLKDVLLIAIGLGLSFAIVASMG